MAKAAHNLAYRQCRWWEAASHSLLTLQYLGVSRVVPRTGSVNRSWEQWGRTHGKGKVIIKRRWHSQVGCEQVAPSFSYWGVGIMNTHHY